MRGLRLLHKLPEVGSTDESVYFIAARSGRIKIGYTSGEPYKRLNSLKTGASEHLRLLGSLRGGRAMEQLFHEEFRAVRVWSNREWFEPTLSLLVLLGLNRIYPTVPVLLRAVVVSTALWLFGTQVFAQGAEKH